MITSIRYCEARDLRDLPATLFYEVAHHNSLAANKVDGVARLSRLLSGLRVCVRACARVRMRASMGKSRECRGTSDKPFKINEFRRATSVFEVARKSRMSRVEAE